MANLKAGTLIGGNLIWNAGNLPLRTSAKNLYIEDAQVYTTAFKPTPADVNAVAKTGDTMTGTLITKQIKVTDQYALTTNSGGNTQGIFLGFSGSDRRTIIGGGDASAGTVVMRPRGIGDANANTVFNTDGTINASVDGTSSSHLVRKGQMDTADNLRLLKAGDTMTGRLVLNYTSSVRVPVGTNDQRGSSETGSFRFNTSETSFEGYDGAEWQPIGSGRVKFAPVTANTTAKKGKGYLVDTTKSGIVVTLPADANDGDFVVIGDGAGNANKNVFYVAGYNGDRIIIDRDNCMLRFSKFGTKWVISDGVGETGAVDTENYVKKAGDTMAGDLKFASGKKIRLATSDWASGAEIYSRPAGDGYGANVYVYAGGNLVLGSGESSRNLESLTTGENFYLTSDGDMRFIVGSNTWTDRNQMTLSSSGRLDIPNGLTVRAASSHIDIIETDSSNKSWRLEGAGGNFSITETGVATRLTLSAGGNATVSGRVSASGFSASTAGNAYTTGKTSDGSYAAVSAESGYVMLWKRNDSTTIADEFIGINKSELIFRQDNKTGDKKYTDCKVYHTKNKPTASDVGAMPISGGAFTDSISLANKAASMTVADDATIRYLYGNSTWFHTYVDKVNGEFTVGSGASGENKLMTINYNGVVGTSGQGVLYGTLNKPTASDVGAMPVTGNINFNWNGHGSNLPGHYAHNLYSSSDKTVYIHAYPTGETASYNSKFQFRPRKGTTYSITDIHSNGITTDGGITTQNGVTITGIGNVIGTIGGYIRSNTADIMSMDGKKYSFVTSPDDAHLCMNAYWDGKDWRKYDNSKHSMYAVCHTTGKFELKASSPSSTSPHELTPLIITHDGNLTTRNAITSNGHTIQISSGDNNQHFWMRNPDGSERALMWHEGAGNTLNFRVAQSHAFKIYPSGTAQVSGLNNGETAFHCAPMIVGGAAGVVRGPVNYGSWNSWRDRASGLQVDVVDSAASATNIWKATHWGAYHMACMDVHAPNGEYVIVRLVAGGDTQFMFYQNGTAYAPAGWHTGSDARFKENIRPLSAQRTSWLDKVCALNASSFKYKTNDNRSIGFIAQDVQEIIPEAISAQTDTTKPEAERADTERLFIDPMAIIAAQNEAIKELVARIEALERK